jgi:hypothetical protein
LFRFAHGPEVRNQSGANKQREEQHQHWVEVVLDRANENGKALVD